VENPESDAQGELPGLGAPPTRGGMRTGTSATGSDQLQSAWIQQRNGCSCDNEIEVVRLESLSRLALSHNAAGRGRIMWRDWSPPANRPGPERVGHPVRDVPTAQWEGPHEMASGSLWHFPEFPSASGIGARKDCSVTLLGDQLHLFAQ